MAETTPAEIAAATSTGPTFETVELDRPIIRGDTSIMAVQIREPGAGELRGLNLQEVMACDVGAMLKLIPRISIPPLTAEEVDALKPSDLALMAGAIRNFFYSAAERSMIDNFIAEQQSKL